MLAVGGRRRGGGSVPALPLLLLLLLLLLPLLLSLLLLPLPAAAALSGGAEEGWDAAQADPACAARFAARRFRGGPAPPPAGGGSCPQPLLWSYLGSGNTMARMLIEVATGIYTGSVYTDLSLLPLFPGEVRARRPPPSPPRRFPPSRAARGRVCLLRTRRRASARSRRPTRAAPPRAPKATCDATTIAVKAHPNWHPAASALAAGPLRPARAREPPDAKAACACRFARAVALVRDPFRVLVTEYQRLRSHDYAACSHAPVDGAPCAGGHVAVLSRAGHDAADFRTEALRMAREWREAFDSYDAFAAARGAGALLYVRWEALAAPGAAGRGELRRLLEFLGAPEAAGDDAALRCAFASARHPGVLRPKAAGAIDAAFVYAADPPLACDVWAVVGARAAALGYAPPGGARCNSADAARGGGDEL